MIGAKTRGMSRKIFCIVLGVVLFATASFAPQEPDLAKYIVTNYTKREVSIPMRDGVKLFTIIYEPKDRSAGYPILLNRTPYSIGPYGTANFAGQLGPSHLYAREGYIFVNQDVRGRFMSEGEYEHIRPEIPNTRPSEIDESTDTYDTIDWLIKNLTNNNGRVGTYGISYPGFYTSAGAVDSHPALKACSPQAPIGDWFRGDDIHHNGAVFLTQNYYFFGIMGQRRPGPTDSWGYIKPWVPGDAPASSVYDFFIQVGGLKEVADTYQKTLGHRVEFWDAMMAHPNYDSWWKDRNILPKLRNIRCATMTVGGWYDNEDLFGALRTYQHIERQNPGIFNVLVVGPWDHGGWAHRDGDWLGTAYFGEKTGEQYRKMELAFFDHFLKGKGDISDQRHQGGQFLRHGSSQMGSVRRLPAPGYRRDIHVFDSRRRAIAQGSGQGRGRPRRVRFRPMEPRPLYAENTPPTGAEFRQLRPRFHDGGSAIRRHAPGRARLPDGAAHGRPNRDRGHQAVAVRFIVRHRRGFRREANRRVPGRLPIPRDGEDAPEWAARKGEAPGRIRFVGFPAGRLPNAAPRGTDARTFPERFREARTTSAWHALQVGVRDAGDRPHVQEGPPDHGADPEHVVPARRAEPAKVYAQLQARDGRGLSEGDATDLLRRR
jgi:putative CocE/NonD family hydrolase